ncbi:glycoside hydrolase family 43 protein [Ramaria rubella]|nr:glycoside hydrolase family 43 protein [Ramaria rubella]
MYFQYVVIIKTALYLTFLFASTFQSQTAVTGPVINADFPDPSILKVDGMSYAFSTNSGGKNIQVATSLDGETWVLTDIDALPVGSWATTGMTWAPDVIDRGDGTFVMYYAAHSISPDTQSSEGGAIDPAGFIDDDSSRWAVYKVDGNWLGGGGPCGNADGSHPTPIRLQQFASDAITPIGDPITILNRNAADGPLIEAPSLIKRDGIYVVFFSSNCFNTDLYDISYATATSITGPYTKAAQPLLITGDDGLTAPGGADSIPDGSMIVFHANIPSGRGMLRLL